MAPRFSLALVLLLGALVYQVSAGAYNVQRMYTRDVYKKAGAYKLDAAPSRFFNQKIDHFSVFGNETFQQRYFVNKDNYKVGGPVFLLVGGAAPMNSYQTKMGALVDLAKKEGALIFALEHRYYGKSQPFDQWSYGNLKYLTVRHALMDMAKFVQASPTLLKQENVTTNGTVKWHAFGENYGGSLAAWFRLKFPHLVASSTASSAPLKAKVDFPEYDAGVAEIAGSACADNLRNATVLISEMVYAPSTRMLVKEKFGCSAIEDTNGFLYSIADIAAFRITASDKTKFCGSINTKNTTLQIENYAASAKSLYTELGVTCRDFDITTYTNVTADDKSYMRQWMYQSCTELGWFQIASPKKPLRSSLLTADWSAEVCKNLFGNKLTPRVDVINTAFGGSKIRSTNSIFVVHNNDPWKALNAVATKNITLITANDTRQAADMLPASDKDSAALKSVRSKVSSTVSVAVGSSKAKVAEDTTTYYSMKTVVIVAVVCGVFCILLGLLLANLICRRGRKQDSDYETLTGENLQ